MGEEGRPEAAWDKRRSTRLCEMHVGVSEALGLICNERLQLQSLVVLGAEEGGSCGFASEGKRNCGAQNFRGGELRWVQPLAAWAGRVGRPHKAFTARPGGALPPPSLGTPGTAMSSEESWRLKRSTAMQRLAAKARQRRDHGEEERQQASLLPGRRQQKSRPPSHAAAGWLLSGLSGSPKVQIKHSKSCSHLLGSYGECPRWVSRSARADQGRLMDGERLTGVWQVPAPFLAGSWRSAGAFLAASAEKSLDHDDCTPPFLSTAFPGHVRGMLLGESLSCCCPCSGDD